MCENQAALFHLIIEIEVGVEIEMEMEMEMEMEIEVEMENLIVEEEMRKEGENTANRDWRWHIAVLKKRHLWGREIQICPTHQLLEILPNTEKL